MIFTFPWPPKELNPNKRLHWAKKAQFIKAYRQECFILAMAKMGGLKPNLGEGKIHLFIDFYPPDRRRRDDDNTGASFKGGRDGLAQAMGIDDSRFISHPCLRDEVRKGGQVVVTVTRIEGEK